MTVPQNIFVMDRGQEQQTNNTNMVKKSYKKHVIWGIVAVVLTTIVVVAVVVGVVKGLKLQPKIINETMQINKQEKTTPTPNLRGHRSWNTFAEYLFINDYNTYISVARLTQDGFTVCYLTSLKDALKYDPFKFDPVKCTNPGNRDNLVWVRSEKALNDTSFLSTEAAKLCQNIPTYWITRGTKPVISVPWGAVCRKDGRIFIDLNGGRFLECYYYYYSCYAK